MASIAWSAASRRRESLLLLAAALLVAAVTFNVKLNASLPTAPSPTHVRVDVAPLAEAPQVRAPSVAAAAEEAHQLVPPILGVTECPAARFATLEPSTDIDGGDVVTFEPYRAAPVDGSSNSGGRRLQWRVRVVDRVCRNRGVKIRWCTTRNTPEAELQARSTGGGGGGWTAVRPGTGAIDVVVDRATLTKFGHTHLCVAVACDGACHKSLDTAACAAWGGRNVLMAPLPPPRGASPTKGGGHLDMLVLLVDSVSWRGFNASFLRTQALLGGGDELSLDVGGRRRKFAVSRFVNSHATGTHSAVNHAPLFLGTHVDKCLAFKSAKTGTPKKRDGEAYHAYKRLVNRVARRASPQLLQREHFLAAFKAAGFLTGLLYPLPYTAPEATCFGLSDESDAAPFVDDVRWRFFSEAVTMFNQDINGSQGCIGERHEADVVDEFVESFFSPSGGGGSGGESTRRIAVVAAQTPHQRRWTPEMIAHYDARVAATLGRFLRGGAAGSNRVVLLLSDHGLGFGADTRAALLPQLEDVLNPVHIWVTAADDAEDLTRALRSNRLSDVSHFDVYETLVDIAGRFSTGPAPERRAAKSTSVVHRVSLVAPGDVPPRTCAEMGLFAHSCRRFASLPLAIAAGGALHTTLTRAVVAHFIRVFSDKADAGGGGSSSSTAVSDELFAPCRNVPHLILTRAVKVHFLSAGARSLADGSCFAHGAFAIDGIPGREAVTFSFSTAVTVVSSDCAAELTHRASLRIAQLTRVSPYAEDERQCGAAVNGRVEIQYCVCR